MNISKYFSQPHCVAQKQYEALRMYYLDNKKAAEVAKKFGYKYRAFTSIVSNFKKEFEQENFNEMFFLQKPTGRPKNKDQYKLKNIIIVD